MHRCGICNNFTNMQCTSKTWWYHLNRMFFITVLLFLSDTKRGNGLIIPAALKSSSTTRSLQKTTISTVRPTTSFSCLLVLNRPEGSIEENINQYHQRRHSNGKAIIGIDKKIPLSYDDQKKIATNRKYKKALPSQGHPQFNKAAGVKGPLLTLQ